MDSTSNATPHSAIPSSGPSWPKNLFCSFRDRQALDEWASFQSWRVLNPDWTVRFYDDGEMENYVRQYLSPEEFAGFMALPKMVAKVDIWRLLILYNEGGLYTDLDVACVKPIDEWVDNPRSEVLLCVDNVVPNNFGQHVLLAKPGNKVMRTALDLAVARCQDPKYQHMDNFGSSRNSVR